MATTCMTTSLIHQQMITVPAVINRKLSQIQLLKCIHHSDGRDNVRSIPLNYSDCDVLTKTFFVLWWLYKFCSSDPTPLGVFHLGMTKTCFFFRLPEVIPIYPISMLTFYHYMYKTGSWNWYSFYFHGRSC